ncbi:ScbA/BarX family gamma-butyrolactone biosynthesis protein [Streptomyces nitrosporeus]|uniref:ScbA/BarX family gamma-butyrolactone biosynthesis protein n=1 Tax=Streptomyces nitrosporeus TaxID=28894 RepID=UPI0033344A4E
MSGGTVPEVPVFPHTLPAPAGGEQAVPRTYVHLSRDESVFVTGWRRLKDGEFSLTARWPAAPRGLRYDPRVLTQTIRQSGLVVAHAAYGVPLSHQTLLHYFDFTVNGDLRVHPAESASLGVEVTVSAPKKAGKAVSSLGMDVRVFQGDTMVARADSEFGWVSPGAYRRLRGESLTAAWDDWPLPDPVEPRTVGRDRAGDVVLAPGGRPRRWWLRHDTSNHLLYDHPVDHVPGLVLMEAADQAARAAVHPMPFEAGVVAASFERYVEFGRPCLIEAEVVPAAGSDRVTVLVTGVQDDAVVFRGRLTGVCG